MTFEKNNDSKKIVQPRTGCGSCGNCSTDTGRTDNQANFGATHEKIRTKSC